MDLSKTVLVRPTLSRERTRRGERVRGLDFGERDVREERVRGKREDPEIVGRMRERKDG